MNKCFFGHKWISYKDNLAFSKKDITLFLMSTDIAKVCSLHSLNRMKDDIRLLDSRICYKCNKQQIKIDNDWCDYEFELTSDYKRDLKLKQLGI